MAKTPGSPLSIAEPAAGAAERPHRFSHEAMATVFEVLVHGQEAEYAQQAAWAAFDEVDRIEADLSRFRPGSDISRINAAQAGTLHRVSLSTFECLQAAARIHAETGGAFDVTVGSLLALWRPGEGGGVAAPSHAELAAARARTAMDLVYLSPTEPAVGLKADGVRVDLGGIGKGFAVDRMMEVLGDWSIAAALAHGGLSTVRAIGCPPGKPGWRVVLGDPEAETGDLGAVHLKDASFSGSSIVHKRHIIDPRSGRPVEGRLGTWVRCESAAVCDALSTAFTVMSVEEVREYCGQHPNVSAMLAVRDSGGRKDLRFGKWGA